MGFQKGVQVALERNVERFFNSIGVIIHTFLESVCVYLFKKMYHNQKIQQPYNFTPDRLPKSPYCSDGKGFPTRILRLSSTLKKPQIHHLGSGKP